MQALLDFLKKYSYWFLFIALEAVSLSVMIRFNRYQSSVWFTQTNRMAAELTRLSGNVTAFLDLVHINEDLTYRNVQLQIQNDLLREALHKANTPELTEQFTDSLKGYRLIAAKVTSASIIRDDNYLIIDKGEADGVAADMGVVAGSGVVGIVYLVNTHYSMVLPIINVKSNISCRIRGLNNFGTLQWEGGSPLHAVLNDIPLHVKVSKGTRIETSGYSNVFPAGLFVGKVIASCNAPDGTSQQLRINLGTDFTCLRDVMVIDNPLRAESDSLRAWAVAGKSPNK